MQVNKYVIIRTTPDGIDWFYTGQDGVPKFWSSDPDDSKLFHAHNSAGVQKRRLRKCTRFKQDEFCVRMVNVTEVME